MRKRQTEGGRMRARETWSMFPVRRLNMFYVSLCEKFPKVTALKDNFHLDVDIVLCLL